MALLVPAIGTALVWSQERAIHEGTTVKLLLLRQKSVQKELEIAPDVVAKIMKFTDAQSEAAGLAVAMPEADRKKAFDKLHEQNHQFLIGTLNSTQKKRLEQIALQFSALHELNKLETSKKLKLTDDQKQKFKDLHAEFRKEMMGLISAKGVEGRSEKFAKLRDKMRMAILDVLTEKQQAIVREMVGPPFTGEIVFEAHEATKKK
jgi:hypothetical protein